MRKLSGILLAGIILAACLTASGQVWAGVPLFMDRSADYSVGYEFTKVRRDPETRRTWTSGIHATGYRIRATDRLYLTGQFCYWAEKYTDGRDPDDLFGSPYIGVEIASRDNLWFQLGVNLPLSSEDNASTRPILADPMRIEFFAPDFLTLSARVQSGYVGRNTKVLWKLGLLYGIYTEDKVGHLSYLGAVERDSEALVEYGIEAETSSDLLRLWMHLHGRFAMTEPGDTADRSTHQFVAGVALTRYWLRPGFHMTVPLDPLIYRFVNFTASFTLTAAWGE
jgi:hypothetical protein